MRIATWNVEWFANLFDRQNQLLLDDAPSGREGVTRAEQIEAVAKVMVAIDADFLLVVEAPNTGHGQSSGKALEEFARSFDLRTKAALEGFENDTHQEITALYDPYVVTARHDPLGDPSGQNALDEAPRFDGQFRLDLDVDGIHETISFSKPPLEAELITARDRVLRLIGVHVKSKAPHGATGPADEVRLAIENRRKQLAQCIWLRRRIDAHLASGDSLIVLGDFNDGPGLDEYEHLFGHSGVEVVLGLDGDRHRRLYDPHAMSAETRRPGPQPASSRFYIPEKKTYLNAMLDFIMVSPDLRPLATRWQIWHPFDNPLCYSDPELREALLAASDHFPVTLDIDL
jgi:hypothetical protein